MKRSMPGIVVFAAALGLLALATACSKSSSSSGGGPAPVAVVCPSAAGITTTLVLNSSMSFTNGSYNITASTVVASGTTLLIFSTVKSGDWITSVGAVCGLGGVTSIPATVVQYLVNSTAGEGIVYYDSANGTYTRIYVVANQVDALGHFTGVQFQYQHPFTAQILTVAEAGTGSGTVTSSPAGISCGSTCSMNFATSSQVTLTAAAASGSTFAGWSGAGGCSGTGTCVLTMSAAESATATFNTSGGGGGGGGGAGYLYSNWSCGGSSQCASVMGGSVGSAGPFCNSSACSTWCNTYIPANCHCASSASYTILNAPAAGTCASYRSPRAAWDPALTPGGSR